MLADGLGVGGIERQIALLSRHLPPTWDCRIWSIEGGPFAEVIRGQGTPLRVRARSWRWDPAPALDLWRQILRWRPDVVHSWGWMGAAMAGPICRLLHIPLVDATIQSGNLPTRRVAASRAAMRFATCIIANSDAGRRAWGVGRRRTVVIHNGVDPRFLQAPALGPPPSGGPFTVVMTGRMRWEKDFASFLAAARALASGDRAGWRFVALGSGPERVALMSSVSDLIEQGVVAFPPPTLDVLPVLERAHAGVLMTHPRLAEGIPNSVVEYMACALPVICSRKGGSAELVVDGVTGFLIDASDVDALVDRLTWLRAHPDASRRMGLAGHHRVATEFSVEQLVARTVAVYERAIAHTRPSSL
jgi:glycosyltransferase involved in cell wall biosynthesis